MDIYCITNQLNGKQYIGKAKNGFYDKYGNLWYKFITNKPILKDIKEYGPNIFRIEIIASTETHDELCALERSKIKEFNTIYPSGYNMQNGGLTGVEIHPETKNKISMKMKSIPLHHRGIFKKCKILNCLYCGKEFKSYQSRGYFNKNCSRECRLKKGK